MKLKSCWLLVAVTTCFDGKIAKFYRYHYFRGEIGRKIAKVLIDVGDFEISCTYWKPPAAVQFQLIDKPGAPIKFSQRCEANWAPLKSLLWRARACARSGDKLPAKLSL